MKANETTIVNNIYLDSPERDSFYENINGDYLRSKTRIRWYDRQMKFVVEEKVKRSSSGFKKRTVIGGKRELRQYLATNSKKPVIENRYERRYFIGPDQVRITIDDLLLFKRPNSNMVIPYEDCIVEIKFDTSYLMDTSKAVPSYLQLSKFSKFADGLSMLGEMSI